jgi:hypothetical protein
MRRREFIKVIAGSAAAWPLVARAEHAGRVRLIGALMGYAENDQTAQSEFAAFRGALAKLGWTENSNVRIETRWGAADPDRIKALAKEGWSTTRCYLRSDHARDQCTCPRDKNNSNSIRERVRSDRQRLCREPRTPWRQHHRFHEQRSRTGR